MLATRISSNIIKFTLTKPSSVSLLSGQTGALKNSNNLLRLYSQEARSGFSRHAERRRVNLKDAATSRPATSTPFNIGQSAVAGASALGLGALAFYGLGLGREAGALDRSVVWPQYVKERIRDTYLYFGASIGATAATAVAVFRTPALANIVFRQGWIALGVSIAAMIGSGILVRSIPYENTLPKHLAWLTHCSVMGAVVAPICLLGGPILTRAAWYTGGMVSGLSLGIILSIDYRGNIIYLLPLYLQLPLLPRRISFYTAVELWLWVSELCSRLALDPCSSPPRRCWEHPFTQSRCTED